MFGAELAAATRERTITAETQRKKGKTRENAEGAEVTVTSSDVFVLALFFPDMAADRAWSGECAS
jgi:hypothetical protein